MNNYLDTMRQNKFLFEELVKRDFKKKYKGTVLGMAWSVLNPLLTLFVMRIIFTRFFGRNTPFYTTYLFAGNLLFSYYREATAGGMTALMWNSYIITRINVPKYLFVISREVSAFINFLLTLVVFFIFAAIDGIHFHLCFIGIIFPIACLTVFNIGVGMILSALYVFFRDMQYIYDVFTMLLMYVSAIFYYVNSFPAWMQRAFLLNPVYCAITYVRVVVMNGHLPSLALHGLLVFYAAAALVIGLTIYKKWNHRFLYYM